MTHNICSFDRFGEQSARQGTEPHMSTLSGDKSAQEISFERVSTAVLFSST